MPRFPTRKVSQERMDALFAERGVWARIHDGQLTSEPIAKATAPSRTYPNAVSQIIKHRDADGNHLVTTHRIISDDDDEQVHHWHGKDILIDGIRLTVA